jgi:hypothetical protein
MASQSLIDELTASYPDVDLGSENPGTADESFHLRPDRLQQIALFDDVLIRWKIVAQTRLSERLAAISDPPRGIIRTPEHSRGISDPARLQA